jgi:hypothetical protein
MLVLHLDLTPVMEAPAMAEQKHYRVTGELVTVKTYVRTATGEGNAYVNLMRGAPIPPDVDPDHLKHLLRKELIEEVTASQAPDDDKGVQVTKDDAADLRDIKNDQKADAGAEGNSGASKPAGSSSPAARPATAPAARTATPPAAKPVTPGRTAGK